MNGFLSEDIGRSPPTEGLKVDGYFFAIDCWRLFSENLVQEVTE